MKTGHLKKIKRNDAIARWVITLGGMLIIFCVIGMFVLIAKEAFPLLTKAKVTVINDVSSAAQGRNIAIAGLDRFKDHAYILNRDGSIIVNKLADGSQKQSLTLHKKAKLSDDLILYAKRLTGDYVYIQLRSGRGQIHRLKWITSYNDDGTRSVKLATKFISESAANQHVLASDATFLESGGSLFVRIINNGQAEISLFIEEENLFGDVESVENTSIFNSRNGEPFTHLALDPFGNTVYLATLSGAIEYRSIGSDGETSIKEVISPNAGSDLVSTLSLALGSDSLAVSRISGKFETLSTARLPETGRRGLMVIHTFDGVERPILEIQPSPRNKTLYTLENDGSISVHYITTEKTLLHLKSPQPITGFSVAPKGDAILSWNKENKLSLWNIDSPHPEISMRGLFGKVHYETYDTPAYVWQSSSGSDDFEPKFSLLPLIFGSLKGTFYAMLFAAPIAILGAIYTSQFAEKRFRGFVKPVVELIGAVPSVVIGFLAALWLAPKLEANLTSFLIFIPLALFCILGMLFLWSVLLKKGNIKYQVGGYEFLYMIPALVVGYLLASTLAPLIETQVFGGQFQQWLYDALGVTYDQRNCFIISIALGFTVIPILYTMTDDALNSVPQSLQAASLAMGATRWQTMMRITLPSASPGIFAAIIIALGRAIGETMIVLMATGNTPIMDWSVFNGMRTLSANIAVEIPEAPVGSTLYRILFLSGILLFMFTSTLNTIAEVIRQKLRKKYGKF